MKRKLSLIAIVILLLGSIFGVLIYRINQPVLVATIGNYNSTQSSAGVDAYRVAEYVINDLNESGANYKLIRFDLEDFNSSFKLKDQVENHDVDIIIGPNTSSEMISIVDELRELEIPVFMTAVSSDLVTGYDDNLFRLTDSLGKQVSLYSEIIMDYTDKKPITIFYSDVNIGYSLDFSRSVEEIYNKENIEINLVLVGDLEDDKVKEMLLNEIDTEVVLIVAGPGRAGIINQLVSQNNEHATFFHSSWAKSDSTLEYIRYIDNPIYSLSELSTVYEKNYEHYEKDILREINIQSSSFSYNTYEVTYFMDYVLQEANGTNLKDIQNIIHEMEIYHGYLNDYTLNNTGDGGRGFSLYRVVNGNYVMEIEKIQ